MVDIIIAQPRGFCAGVERAITIVEKALEKYGAPVYVRHEIVHNQFVVDCLRQKGAVFVDEIDEIPEGAITVFSAHGVAESVEIAAKQRNLPVLDATCPLVSKVHLEAQRYESGGKEIILIGHDGHPEVEGTSGRVQQKVHLISSTSDIDNLRVHDEMQLAYITQTTLSADDTRDIITALKRRFPAITGPDLKDICYATQNRQNAVRDLAQHVDMILVIGAENSSNSNRLRDLGEEMGIPSYLIPNATAIHPKWLENIRCIGITAGASAPEILVEETVDRLKELCGSAVVSFQQGIEENVHFKLPKSLVA